MAENDSTGNTVRSAEEATILNAYRQCSRWEKNALFLTMQSVAWGRLNSEKTDDLSWKEVRKILGLGDKDKPQEAPPEATGAHPGAAPPRYLTLDQFDILTLELERLNDLVGIVGGLHIPGADAADGRIKTLMHAMQERLARIGTECVEPHHDGDSHA